MEAYRPFLPHSLVGFCPVWRSVRPSLSRAARLRQVAEVLALSKPARTRLEWMLWYEGHGRNALATGRHFGIAPKTFYKWRALFQEGNLRTLEDRSRAPHRKRQRETTREVELRIVALKRAHIRYGKAKIATLYATQYGGAVSQWKVQKTIEAHRLYYHPVKQARINRKRQRSVNRKRITDLKTKPLTGFLLCLDTVVIYWKSAKRYIFTAVDKHAKVAFARMYRTKSSLSSRDFLVRLRYLLDNRIKNLGHDNGSEFQGEFARACQRLDIPQYHSRIKTPKDNAVNERFNRTLQEEFIQLGNMTDDTVDFNRRLTEWLVEYNFRRPHQSLGYLAPMQFIHKHQPLLPMYPSSTER